MPTPDERYMFIINYVKKLYDAPLYERHGLMHPVIFHPADDIVRNDSERILGDFPSETLPPESLAFYNHAYLHDLQNSDRQLHNGKTFAFKRLRTNPLRVDAVIGNYFDMIATSIALEQELRDAAFRPFIRVPMRTQYHRSISTREALTSGKGRSAALGVAVLMVINQAGDYKAVLARRRSTHATRPSAYHVLPTFIFQPMADTVQAHEWSLRYHFEREWLEELFAMPESATPNLAHPALQDLRRMETEGLASLHLSGLAMNLLTLRLEFCMLLLIHDATWWERVNQPSNPMKLDAHAETSEDLLLASIESDSRLLNALPKNVHLNMPPHAIPTLWEGVDLARTILAGKAS